MEITLYAEQSHLSLRLLNWMVKQKIIQNPLTHEDLVGLQLLEKVWWRREVLRAQLVKLTKKDRQRLIETVDFDTKWERYAFSRYCNLPPGCRLPMKQLIGEIELTYDFRLNWFHRRKLYKVRQRAYDRRRPKSVMNTDK